MRRCLVAEPFFRFYHNIAHFPGIGFVESFSMEIGGSRVTPTELSDKIAVWHIDHTKRGSIGKNEGRFLGTPDEFSVNGGDATHASQVAKSADRFEKGFFRRPALYSGKPFRRAGEKSYRRIGLNQIDEIASHHSER